MLQFIGRGSAFNTEEGNNSAFFIHEGELVLIDCGSNIFDRLKKSGILKTIKNIRVLITHTHPDHIGSLGDLIFYSYFKMGNMGVKNLTVYAPYVLKVPKIMKHMGVTTDYYNIKQFDSGIDMVFEGSNIAIVAVPNSHVQELLCFGYIIEAKDKVIYYSGDSNKIHQSILNKIGTGQIDYFYQDTSYADYPGNVHLSLNKLCELVPENRDNVYIMHIDEGFPEYLALDYGFNVVHNAFKF